MPLVDDIAPDQDIEQLRASARVSKARRWSTVQLTLKTVTPVFGGGTVAGEIDLLVPFRPRTIRNGLRHWWWLLNRHDSKYLGANGGRLLYEDMTSIWGGAADEDSSCTSRVRVRVEKSPDLSDANQTCLFAPYTISRRQGGYKIAPDLADPAIYALWMAVPPVGDPQSATLGALFSQQPGYENRPQWKPDRTHRVDAWNGPWFRFSQALAHTPNIFDRDNARRVTRLIRPGVQFSLAIDISLELSSEQEKQVGEAINAWLHLGGVGARTSRGLGRCEALTIRCPVDRDRLRVRAVVDPASDAWFLSRFANSSSLREDLVSNKPIEAWIDALHIYRDFRQARQCNDNGIRSKRSYWPKADVIRIEARRRGHTPHPEIERGGFLPVPELFFGAPIVYKFAGGGEPAPGELVFSTDRSPASKLDRYASPLIVTCLRVEGGFAPLALRLEHIADIQDKHIFAANTQRAIAPGKWWPDLNTASGQSEAEALLAGAVRHAAIPPADPRWRALNESAAGSSGNPIEAFLNFFYSWEFES